jgi:chitodextrinase
MDLLSEYRKIINPPYQANDLVIVFLSLFILMSIPLTAFASLQSRQTTTKAAGTATLALSPTSKSVNQGESFAVEIREDSNTDPVNAVQANLTYDASMLNVTSVDYTGSAFGIQAEETLGSGTIELARGVSGGNTVTGDQLFAKVNFTAKTVPGTTTVSFGAGSAIVRATDNSDILGSTVPGTYTIGDPPPVVTITNPAEGEEVSGTVSVTATATDNIGVTKVEFRIDGNLRNTDTATPYAYNWDTTTDADGEHTVSAKAYDVSCSANCPEDSITVTVRNVDTQPPTAPTNLSATAPSHDRVDLTWNASTDNVGVAGYWVVRGGVTIAQTSATSYPDSSVLPSTEYSYQVIAFDAADNNSQPSNTATVTTPEAPDTQEPSVPTGLDASAVSSTQINLTWNASSDNVGVAGYRIYRNSSSSPIATVGNTSYGDTGLSPSTTYAYVVRAFDAAGNTSGPSNTASATTLQPEPDGTLVGQVTSASTGDPVAGVIIKVSIPGVKGKRGKVGTTTTNASGLYAMTLNGGSYTLQTSIKGFHRQSKPATIISGGTTTVNFSLAPKGKKR